MKSILLSAIIVIVLMSGAHSQDHKNVIGGRLGLSSGITYQYLVDDFRGYKGMMSFRDGGVQLTALLESYRPLYLNFTDKMYYYAGMGAHIGFTRWQPRRGFFSNPFRYSGGGGHFAPVIGLDAIIGIEFRLSRTPLIFSLDAKPFFELFGQNMFRLSLFDIGLSVKFTFK